MSRALLLAWFALCVLPLAAQGVPDPPPPVPLAQGWLAAGGPLESREGLDGFWRAPGFTLPRESVVVLEPASPRLPEGRDARDRAFSGRLLEGIQSWFQAQLPAPTEGGAPPQYRLEFRILDVRTVRQGTTDTILGLYQVPLVNLLLLPALPAALAAIHEAVVFEVKVVDQASGATQAALRHRSAGSLGWLGLTLNGALKSFLAQLGLDPLPRAFSTGPPPWGPAPPFPSEGKDTWIWLHPDLPQRLGSILVRPWPAPAATDPKDWKLYQEAGWSERLPTLFTRALRRQFVPRLGPAAQRPPLVLEGRADMACTHDESLPEVVPSGSERPRAEDGPVRLPSRTRTHAAFQVALKDPATGEVLAAAEGDITPGNPFAGVPWPHRWVRRVVERLAQGLPPGPGDPPVTWFPGDTVWRKDLPGVDQAWFAPDFSLSGKTLWIQPWEDPALDPATRDAKDLASADDFTDLAPAELLGALGSGLPPEMAVSRRYGDVALRGRVLDVSVAGFARTAFLGLFGGSASHLLVELQVVDLRTGEVKAGFRHRIVSMTGSQAPPIHLGLAVGSFLYKFRKFTGPLANALAHSLRTDGTSGLQPHS